MWSNDISYLQLCQHLVGRGELFVQNLVKGIMRIISVELL